MKFEENLREARSRFGYSQEELAEKVGVSRQAVSKWENGSAYPELDKLMNLCELFHCTLDDLLKGDMKESKGLSREDYEHHEKSRIRNITTGILIILAGVCSYCFLTPTMQDKEDILNIVFMVFVLIGTIILVFAGMQDASFKRKYPSVPQDIYTEEELDAFDHKYSITVTVGVALILISLIIEQLLERRVKEYYAYGVFMMIVTIAVGIFVYYGMYKEVLERTSAYKKLVHKQEELIGKWCGCIMLVAAAVYVVISFLWNIWEISWVVFVVGGILCGIVSIVLNKSDDGEK